MRPIKYIVVHCTGTGPKAQVKAILNYWKSIGWKNPGYHFLIDSVGYIHELHPVEKPSNGVKGYNHESIHICYIGGIDKDGSPEDTRTPAQKQVLRSKLHELKTRFPDAIIQGHRDFPNVAKACPSFDAKSEYDCI